MKDMNAETVMGLAIMTLVALVMLTIGIYQFKKKDEPVGFYNLTAPPKKEEITDIRLFVKNNPCQIRRAWDYVLWIMEE